MSRDEAFELQLARWLQEGPYDAPPQPMDAALRFIREDPRRRLRDDGLWRRIVNGIGLTRVPSPPRPRWLPVGAGIVVIAAVALVGYGLLDLKQGVGPAGGPSPTPAVTPAPTGPSVATTQQTCAESRPEITTEVDGVLQSRGTVLDCVATSSDPRLAGAVKIEFNSNEDRASNVWRGWGTYELRNDGGTWRGSYAILTPPDASVMEFDAVWIGYDGYEGLEVLSHVRQMGLSATLQSRISAAGTVVTGTEQCTTTANGTQVSVGAIDAFRDVGLTCADAMSDPRVTGQRSVTVSIDRRRADGSADLWGTSTLTSDAGAWQGFFFGTVDPGYTTHRIKGMATGSGPLAGLFYRFDLVAPPDGESVLTGEIIAGW